MTYHQFVKEVELRIRKGVADNICVRIHVALKNNGCKRHGIMLTEEGINISPTIYLEEYYQQFQSGDTLERITEKILNCYEEVRFRRSWESSFFASYENVKSMIVYKVISKERNEELLEYLPYRERVDLALVCYVLVELNVNQTATVLIRKEHLKLWNVTEEEVFEEAEKNVRRLLPAKLDRMKDVLACMLELPVEEDDDEDIMYVMSNEIRSFGAACIFYEGVMEMIRAVLKENYYIVPSSVHEVIILPESMAPGKREMEEVVAAMNETQVEAEEILSDKVYYYNGESRQLSM